MTDSSDRSVRSDLEYELGRIDAALHAIATLLDTGDVSGRGEDVGALVGIVADRLSAARAELFGLLEDADHRSGPGTDAFPASGGFPPGPFGGGIADALRAAGIHPDRMEGGVVDMLRQAGVRPSNDKEGQ